MFHSKIAGIGFHVPERVVTNDDLARVMDTSDEWIRERTGIEERRYVNRMEDNSTTLGAKAARIAIERAGITAEDVDFIIFATLSPDYYFPGNGVLLQRELGITKTEIGALDIRTRLQMQDLLTSIWHKFQSTIIFVTHDISEAAYLADDIYIMKAQPSKFVEHIHVDLPLVRNRFTKRDANYTRLVHEVEDRMMSVAEMG